MVNACALSLITSHKTPAFLSSLWRTTPDVVCEWLFCRGSNSLLPAVLEEVAILFTRCVVVVTFEKRGVPAAARTAVHVFAFATCTVAATDFPGQLVHAVESIPLNLEKTEESVHEMCLAVRKCLESKMRIDSSAVAGYGVDITGRVNHGTGYSYSFFISEEKPFRDLLEAEFGKPVVVENDCRAMAWSE